MTPDQALDAALQAHATAVDGEMLGRIDFVDGVNGVKADAGYTLTLDRVISYPEPTTTPPGRHVERLAIIGEWRRTFLPGPSPATVAARLTPSTRPGADT